MYIILLIVLGLILGSFINALVWRIHEADKEESKKKVNKSYLEKLSIVKGRSLCPKCKHILGFKDLVPVFSWLALKARCRYCNKPISAQYPLVELFTAAIFAVSYLLWPVSVSGIQVLLFALWLILLIGLIALSVYDLRWFMLPNRIIYPLSAIAAAIALVNVLNASNVGGAIVRLVIAVAVGGGIFYLLFMVSGGKWIGGGDVKLGWLLGMVAGTPQRSLLFIFIASVLGSIISVALISTKVLKRKSLIPFGPFLIVGLVIVQFFGSSILSWYQRIFINP